MILGIILAAVATMGFSVIFNVPRRELAFCGLAGGAVWLIFLIVTHFFPEGTIPATFFGAMAATTLGRFLSALRKMPSTVYMIPGIIPLVPGVAIYRTMFYVVGGEHMMAVTQGVYALSLAGVIAVGVLIVLSLPRRLFLLGHKN
ncbi:MAG: threonine/serine exporter family protein [Defluviitaleaceae bacterium]|nr:threonine/serine exporter family protein [Defluviitaleaceae bacterium]